MKAAGEDIFRYKRCFGAFAAAVVVICTARYGLTGVALSASFLWAVSILVFDVFGNGLTKEIMSEPQAEQEGAADIQAAEPDHILPVKVQLVHVHTPDAGRKVCRSHDEIAAMDPSGDLRRDVDALLPGADEGTKAAAAYDLMNAGVKHR